MNLARFCYRRSLFAQRREIWCSIRQSKFSLCILPCFLHHIFRDDTLSLSLATCREHINRTSSILLACHMCIALRTKNDVIIWIYWTDWTVIRTHCFVQVKRRICTKSPIFFFLFNLLPKPLCDAAPCVDEARDFAAQPCYQNV